MRIVVIGSTGAGKTTLGKRLAAARGLPYVELDAIQWQPGWQPLVETNQAEFIRRVDAATAGESWVVDGNYKAARHLTWGRATHLVWLDYGRTPIMFRVIRRSLVRSVLQTELWAGNREQWRNMLRADHPIWWAWKTWHRHRAEWAELLTRPEFSHLAVSRVRRPREVQAVIRHLSTAAWRP